MTYYIRTRACIHSRLIKAHVAESLQADAEREI